MVNKLLLAGAFGAGAAGAFAASRALPLHQEGPLNILVRRDSDPKPNRFQLIVTDIIIEEQGERFTATFVGEGLAPVHVLRPVSAKQGVLDLFNKR